MRISTRLALAIAVTGVGLWAQPTFRIEDRELRSPLTLIAYGDQRFTDPANTRRTNPRIRQWLVGQIAKERPDAVIMNGDIPLAGEVANDYAVFRTETKVWRDLFSTPDEVYTKGLQFMKAKWGQFA